MDSPSLKSFQEWLRQLLDAGWIDHEAATEAAAALAPPGDLFPGRERPLIVAFFGGTGVGKSTLLNRLAGEKIAETGIERPTSREVTVYLHQALPTESLKHHLPLAQVRLARHRNDNRRQIVWLDMPDVDSVEESNRRLVLQCLPYVDVLVYVVSPERYRDDSGWQLLKQHEQDHAWLFVMNHWDQGDELQIQDFRSQLQEAGFRNPMILRCDSREDFANRLPDDFGKLEEVLTRLVRSGGVKRLQHQRRRQRNQRLRQAVEGILRSMGDPQRMEDLKRRWREIWRQTQEAIAPAIQWQIVALAEEIAGKGEKSLDSDTHSHPLRWDMWARTHLSDAFDRLLLETDELGVASEPLRRRLQPYRDTVETILKESVQKSLAATLANPGNGLRRSLLWISGMLRYLLPLGAASWVGWQVVSRYYQGMLGQDAWLGVDFAVHSLLLIGLSWLVPHFLHKLLQPSMEKLLAAGIRQGVDNAFETIAVDVERLLETLCQTLQHFHQEGRRIDHQSVFPEEESGKDALLDRLLAGKQPNAVS